MVYSGVQGHEVYIDRYGDAEGNYSLLSLKNDDVYHGTMRPVGNFQMTSGGLGLPVSKLCLLHKLIITGHCLKNERSMPIPNPRFISATLSSF